jgi:hypothetical protein
MSSSESDSSDAPETISLKTAKRESTKQRKGDEERQRASVLDFNQPMPVLNFAIGKHISNI